MDIYGNDDTSFEIPDSKWKKLITLKPRAVLSYAHTVLPADTWNMVKYDSKYAIIDMLVELGFADDMINAYY